MKGPHPVEDTDMAVMTNAVTALIIHGSGVVSISADLVMARLNLLGAATHHAGEPLLLLCAFLV